jgi:hypothetical protein
MPIPNTRTASQHIISIRLKGVTIGLIQRWSPRQTRRMTPIYEINQVTSGRRVDIVPGNVETLQIDVDRYDLFNTRMHQAFGFAASAINLADHTNPFDVQELWQLPSGLVIGTIYQNCWFTNIGREYTAQGDRVIMARGQLEVTDILNL